MIQYFFSRFFFVEDPFLAQYFMTLHQSSHRLLFLSLRSVQFIEMRKQAFHREISKISDSRFALFRTAVSRWAPKEDS